MAQAPAWWADWLADWLAWGHVLRRALIVTARAACSIAENARGEKRMGEGIIGAAVRWLMTIVGGLLAALSVIALYFTSVLIATAAKRGELAPKVEAVGLGAVTNFFDTLGIGSFAPSTAWMKL